MNEEFWNERYAQDEYIYGEEPNEYLRKKLSILSPGKILFPADGEGRNSVYAALKGWDSEAFDISIEGKIKAELLAQEKETRIYYTVSDVEHIEYPKSSFDALALIYAHFPLSDRSSYHQKLSAFVKKDGFLILEAFSKSHTKFQKVDPQVGGPKDPEMLYHLDDIISDFPDFEFKEAIEEKIQLNEGNHHKGTASVIRVFAKKIT